MKLKGLPNPFAGLTEEQHCFNHNAEGSDGTPVGATDSTAIRWCANGAMMRAFGEDLNKLREDAYDAFSDFLWEQHRTRPILANDDHKKPFSWFADVWDRWQASLKEDQ